jgi:hypothetical protein
MVCIFRPHANDKIWNSNLINSSMHILCNSTSNMYCGNMEINMYIQEKFYLKTEYGMKQVKFSNLKNGDIIRKYNDKKLWRIIGKIHYGHKRVAGRLVRGANVKPYMGD